MPDSEPQMICRERGDGTLEVELSGGFRMSAGRLPACPQTDIRGLRNIVFLDRGITSWDTSLLTLLLRTGRVDRSVDLDIGDLPEGVRTLHRLAADETSEEEPPGDGRPGLTTRVGRWTRRQGEGAREMLAFVGDTARSLGRMAVGRARFRGGDLWTHLRNCGPDALGIVGVISLLVGAILAFVGAVQLRMFGAEMFVANLVGLGMVMEMGALMTGIILAGRTGAAFAAQLGTMRVNEEVDALVTMGIRPADYLVAPRVLALSCMTPLLVMYANALGIAGGGLVGVLLLELPPAVYLEQAFAMMTPWHVWQGLIKGASFGVWVAVAGCLRGMRSGRSASEVGRAATSAVVTGILGIVVIDALWTWLFLMMDKT